MQAPRPSIAWHCGMGLMVGMYLNGLRVHVAHSIRSYNANIYWPYMYPCILHEVPPKWGCPVWGARWGSGGVPMFCVDFKKWSFCMPLSLIFPEVP